MCNDKTDAGPGTAVPGRAVGPETDGEDTRRMRMMGVESTSGGIAPAPRGSALHTLQFSDPRVFDGQVRSAQAVGSAEHANVELAAREVSRYHEPTPGQVLAYQQLSNTLAYFLAEIVRTVPPGPERSTAISRAREAKMWASAAIALEGR